MNITQVSQKLINLTQQFQQMLNLAKRVEELPVQETLEPTSKIHVSNAGVSQSLEVRKIIEAASSLAFNRLLSVGDFTLVGNILTVPELAQWLIENVIYSNAVAVDFNVPFSAFSRIRRDVIFGNNDGQILRQVGLEINNEGIDPPKPAIPPNTVEITSFEVTDTNIGLPDVPIIGVNAITKISQGWLLRNFSGENLRLSAYSASGCYELTGESLSLDGISTTGFQNQFEWDGQEFVIFRNSPNPITLNQGIDDFLLMPFVFPNDDDFIMAAYSLAKFKRRDNKIYLLSYSVLGSGGIPTLDEVLVASSNTTTKKIIQNIPNASGFGFDTNLAIRGGYVYAQMLNGAISLGNNSADFERNATRIKANRKIYYDEIDGVPVPTDFSGREVPDVNFNDARYTSVYLTGLGSVVSPVSTDCNINVVSGVSRITPTTLNSPFQYGTLNTISWDANSRTQTAVDLITREVYTRVQLDSIWYSWEIMAKSNSVIKKEGGTMTGTLVLGKFTTETEPALVQGAIYFNTSINKMKIGGTTDWEIITSS